MKPERPEPQPNVNLNPLVIPPMRTFSVLVGNAEEPVEILWQGTATEGAMLGSFSLTRETICMALDHLFRKMVADHAAKAGFQQRVEQMVERCMIKAVKDFEQSFVREAAAMARDTAIKRVRAAVEAVPIRVEVTTTPPPANTTPDAKTGA